MAPQLQTTSVGVGSPTNKMARGGEMLFKNNYNDNESIDCSSI
jgi:hypothetical protein